MLKLKKNIQKIIRTINVLLFKKNLPEKISIYFHDVNEEDISNIKLIVKFFKYSGYQFCNINYLNEHLENDKKLIALTFDDGFQSWVKLIPFFNEENIEATFFVNTIFFEEKPNLKRFYKNINSSGKELLLTSNDLEKIVEAGHEIGSHTHTHRTLSQLSKEEFVNEIEINLNYLNELGITAKSFAIPFGMKRYIKNYQIDYLQNKFEAVCFGEPGMLFNHKIKHIQRYPWLTKIDFHENIKNISTNTSFFNALTKRSGLG